jgi:hypothetical protein
MHGRRTNGVFLYAVPSPGVNENPSPSRDRFELTTDKDPNRRGEFASFQGARGCYFPMKMPHEKSPFAEHGGEESLSSENPKLQDPNLDSDLIWRAGHSSGEVQQRTEMNCS